MNELVCVHRWSKYDDYGGWLPVDAPVIRMRVCQGLCKQYQKEGDPEPRVVIARME